MWKSGRTFQAGYIRIVVDILMLILLDDRARRIARTEATAVIAEHTGEVMFNPCDHHFRFICVETSRSAVFVSLEVEYRPLAACTRRTSRTLPCMHPCGHPCM